MEFTSTLYNMYGRELDKKTHKLLPNGEKHFGLVPIVQLDDSWYDFTNVPQETNYVKIETLRCVTERKAMNQAKRICPNLPYPKKFFIITKKRYDEDEARFQESLTQEQAEQDGKICQARN